ncbi:MAG: protein kinase domain-containing protein [Limisphaerales bacterium]
MPASAVAACPVCGTPRHPGVLGGQCPRCVLHGTVNGAFGNAPPPDAAGWVPEDFGDFIIEECVGRGPRGVVYRGLQPSILRPVALKFFDAPPERAEHLIAAADCLGSADHPALAPVFCAGAHRGRPYLVMPFAAGGNLRRQLAGEPPSAILVARLVAVLARAVAAAHRAGLTHSRLTPENVVFDEAGYPTVTDFVAAGLPEPGGAAARPADAEFLAPEAATASAAGPAADVFSLGAILRLCLQPVRSTDDAPEFGSGLRAVAGHCLEPDPAARPPTAAALAETLELWLDHSGTSALEPVAEDATPVWG